MSELGNQWKNALSDPPKKIGLYFGKRLNEDSNSPPYLTCERFDYQFKFETRFSQEFDQNVTIKVHSDNPEFLNIGDSFVCHYMEIPGETYEEF